MLCPLTGRMAACTVLCVLFGHYIIITLPDFDGNIEACNAV